MKASFCTALALLLGACAPSQPATSAAAPAAEVHAAPHGSAEALRYSSPEADARGAQSPINIVTSRAGGGSHGLQFHYLLAKEHLVNLGHTVRVNYEAGNSLEFDGKNYELTQFHLHTPSEHLLDGVTYPMELHLVHTEREHPEHFLVVGVLFREGKANPLVERVLTDVPSTVSEGNAEPASAEAGAVHETELDAASLIGASTAYFHYEGSLTTAPYTEAVTWVVLEEPREASPEQIEAMNRIEGNNARHIQDQHARLVDHDR